MEAYSQVCSPSPLRALAARHLALSDPLPLSLLMRPPGKDSTQPEASHLGSPEKSLLTKALLSGPV